MGGQGCAERLRLRDCRRGVLARRLDEAHREVSHEVGPVAAGLQDAVAPVTGSTAAAGQSAARTLEECILLFEARRHAGYSTCSFCRCQNEDIVEEFIAEALHARQMAKNADPLSV